MYLCIVFLIIFVCLDYLINFNNNKKLYLICHIKKKTRIASLGKFWQICEEAGMLMHILVGIN